MNYRTCCGWRGCAMVAIALVSACASQLAAPPMTEWGAAGSHQVLRSGPLAIDVAGRAERLEYVAYFPDGNGRYPLVVFSHGSLCDADHNDGLSRHWASHGYVVIQPRHLDSAPATFESGLDPAQVWRVRRDHMAIVADEADVLLAHIDRWKGSLDRRVVTAAGHSYGALTAQATAGAITGSFEAPGESERHVDDRYDVVVAIAPPGPMQTFVTEATGSQIEKPMLVAVGTEDAYPPLWPTWESHRLTFDTAPGGDHYLAIIDGADHRYGGLICSENEDPPQPTQLGRMAAVTTLFLDAYVKGDAGARGRLSLLTSEADVLRGVRFEAR